MKLKATIISLVSVLVVGLTAILLYCFWPAIKGTVNNSKYYTQEELQESYDKGYDDGCKSESELTAQVKYYKKLVDEYYIQVNTLNDEITMLTQNKSDYENQIITLRTQKANLQTQVENLTTIKTNNETTINSLNNQIIDLQKQVTNLTNSGNDKSEQITVLNEQITTLKNTVIQLQNTNDMNIATITSLNTQIANLNTQISDMTLQSQNSQNQINSLNSRITELQSSVSYYENYIAQLENGEQVVATFEFDGSVYNIQIVNKGSKLSVTTPTSTAYKIFNGWTVNGSAIDLSTYAITTNTKFIADVTYKYDVKFKVDDTIYNSQIIIKNNCAILPTNPTKDGYEFNGWSLNGVDVISDITTRQVTQNVTYTAVFTKIHTVTFMYEGQIKATQKIRNGNFANNVTVANTTYKVFNGWKVNGNIVNLSNYKIIADTTFVADVTYKYDVKFKVDDTIYNSQIITKNNFATLPTNPTKDGYEFDGWSLNGVDIVSNITTTKVTQNVTYTAVFTKVHTVKFISDNVTKVTQQIRNGNYITTLPTNPTKDGYTFNGWSLNKTDIVDVKTISITNDTSFFAVFEYAGLTQKTWSGLTNFDGRYVWSDDSNTYYSRGTQQYVLNKNTSTWEQKTWTGLTDVDGSSVFNVFENSKLSTYCCYDRDNCVYKLIDNTWKKVNIGLLAVDASYVWSDGNETFYSCPDEDTTYVFCYDSKDGYSSLCPVSDYDFSDTIFESLDGSNIWQDPLTKECFYSSVSVQKEFYFDINNSDYVFVNKTWSGLTNFYGYAVWNDGKNIYYSKGAQQYILNRETSTWTQKKWSGLTNFDAQFIWSDGSYYYYSNGSVQYQIPKAA